MDTREKIMAVERMQDYIAKHITEPITLHQLAEVAGYSPWHSNRIFKELTGKAPFEYIRSFRLSQAAVKLKNERAKIVDVALDFLFGSHEGFTRAFSREFGVTPRYYSKNTPPIKLFLPENVRDKYLKLTKGVDYPMEKSSDIIFTQVVDRPKRRLILKRGVSATEYFQYCEEVGCEVWDILSGIKEALYEPIGMWMPDNLRKEGTSIYCQGVEVPEDYSGALPEGFEMIDLPPCKIMIFQGQPYEEGTFEEAITTLWEAIKNYNPEIYGFKWADEDGPRFQLAPMGFRGYIEARPVRMLNA